MTSFLATCQRCGTTIAKGSPCPDCRWSEDGPSSDVSASHDDTLTDFALRYQVHKRNYLVFMLLSFTAGLIGLITAVMWAMVIFRGSLLAFISIGFFTILTGVLAGFSYLARQWMPYELNCPNCEIRLDELGPVPSVCPSCSAQLMLDPSQSFAEPAAANPEPVEAEAVC